MPRRRLVAEEEVLVWSDALRAAALSTIDVHARQVTATLSAHGLSWSSPVEKTALTLWSQVAWAKTVEEDFTPVAREVARSVLSTVQGRVLAKARRGMRDPVREMTEIAVRQMLAGGELLNSRMTGGPRRRPGSIVGAGANLMSIRDALDDAADALGTLASRTGNQMANAASVAVVEAVDSNAEAAVMQEWWTQGDDRVRIAHEEMEGQERAPGDPFEDGDGNLLMYPGDPNAPAETTENCLAPWEAVTLPGLRASTRRRYEGDLVLLRFARGGQLAVTPNHPVLRADGRWTAAHLLQVGDDCVSGQLVDLSTGEPDVERGPAKAAKVHRAANLTGVAERVRGRGPDFHGDGNDGHVDVVAAEGELRHEQHAASGEQIAQFGLTLADLARAGGGDLAGTEVVVTTDEWTLDWATTAARLVGGSREPGSLLGRGAAHAEHHPLAPVADGHPGSPHPSDDGHAVDVVAVTERRRGLALEVETDRLVDVEVAAGWAGVVYNFDTGHGWYLSRTGIVLANCRCELAVSLPASVADYPTGGDPDSIRDALGDAVSALDE